MATYSSVPTDVKSGDVQSDIEISLVSVHADIEQDHVCVMRKEPKGLMLFWAWYLPPIHVAFSAAFWYGMRFLLQNRIAAVGRGDNVPQAPPGRWYQSDITTFVAVLLTMSRIIAGILQSLTTWRCILLLFEQELLRLPEFKFISSYKLPAPSLPKSSLKSSTMWLAGVAILLAWPAQLASPIATGSLTWIPNNAYDNSKQGSVQNFTDIASEGGFMWTDFQQYQNFRLQLVQASAGLAIVESHLLADTSNGMMVPPARRPTYRFRELSNGTSIEHITVPYFDILSIKWLADPSTALSSKQQDAIVNDRSGYLNISGPTSPLWHANVEGVVAPLKNTVYDISKNRTYASPYVFHRTKYAALLIHHNDVAAPCSFDNSVSFTTPPDAGLIKQSFNDGPANCYAVAQIDLVAGMVPCRRSEQDPRQCSLSTQSSLSIISHDTYSSNDVMPDPLIDVVFATIPEVMALMITTSGFGSTSPFRKVDPEQFLRAALTLGYQGTWAGLAEPFVGPKVTVDYIEPVSVVVSAVSTRRMDMWLSIQMLLAVAVLMVAFLRSRSRHPVVTNPILKHE